jgi:protein translocase SecG subunit
MLKTIWFSFSLLLIVIIFLRMPPENNGLSNFMGSNSVFGSSTATEQNLNYGMGIIIICYLVLAFYLND